MCVAGVTCVTYATHVREAKVAPARMAIRPGHDRLKGVDVTHPKVLSAWKRLSRVKRRIAEKKAWIAEVSERMSKDRERLDTAGALVAELENEREEIETWLAVVAPDGTPTIDTQVDT